ncbi:hypothetical protein BGW80DRAFT_1311182 [Lactifluus volemus]|nr:hypothetical protein BGW80DRAFT_1311182 [Lactifluus volemus]
MSLMPSCGLTSTSSGKLVQADMIAYHEPGERLRLGLPVINSIGAPKVTQLVANISGLYSPKLAVGFTPVSTNGSKGDTGNLLTWSY